MKTIRQFRAPLLLLLSCGLQGTPASVPSGVHTSLAGEKVEFPRDLRGPVSFLIVGFTEKSADQATEWGKAIDGVGTCEGRRLTWFQMPVIAGAPGFVRPFILRSMRSDLTPALQRHFVPITDREADWKLAAGYGDKGPQKDDAYVIATDEKGGILATWHGSKQSSEPVFQENLRRYCPGR